MGQREFWDWQERHQYLEEKKDILLKLNQMIPWSEFRPILERVHQKQRRSNAGTKPYDVMKDVQVTGVATIVWHQG